MGVAFETAEPDLHDEDAYIRPAELARSLQELAAAKARSVSAGRPAALVLGTDTVVTVDGAVFGKPAGDADARRMLRILSGRGHSVLTAVALVCEEAGFHASECAETRVFFRKLSDGDIDRYIASGEYRDKAGAYGIQEGAMVFAERIEGCYFNVVGLPVGATIRCFQQFVAKGRT